MPVAGNGCASTVLAWQHPRQTNERLSGSLTPAAAPHAGHGSRSSSENHPCKVKSPIPDIVCVATSPHNWPNGQFGVRWRARQKGVRCVKSSVVWISPVCSEIVFTHPTRTHVPWAPAPDEPVETMGERGANCASVRRVGPRIDVSNTRS